MTAFINIKAITAIAILCLFICNTSCLESSKTTELRKLSAPTDLANSEIASKSHGTEIFRFNIEADDAKDKRKREDKDKNDDNANDKNVKARKKYEESQSHSEESDSDNDDDDKKKNKPSTTPTSNTVVTTIIVISTETPTAIYSGTTANPAKQKGDTSSGKSHEVTDPNSTTSSSNPAETTISQQVYNDQSKYRKLVTALSVVGSVAGICLLAGLLVFARRRARKRQRKNADLESANSSHDNSTAPTQPTHFDHHQPPSPPSHARFSAMSTDVEPTLTNYTCNPFTDPSDNKNTTTAINSIRAIDMFTIPTAMYSQPNRHDYTDSRRSQTFSMLSQTTATALPSAPSAKELDEMAYDGNDPFGDEYSQESHQRMTYTLRKEAEEELTKLPSPTNSHSIQHFNHVQRISTSPPHSPLININTLQLSSPSAGPETFVSDLAPPPAYTPKPASVPSAPPLYALPTSVPLASASYIEQQNDDSVSSRRHSISSCSITSIPRPLSLRRGSGSLAHASSSFT